jgi:hypothetical protein
MFTENVMTLFDLEFGDSPSPASGGTRFTLDVLGRETISGFGDSFIQSPVANMHCTLWASDEPIDGT